MQIGSRVIAQGHPVFCRDCRYYRAVTMWTTRVLNECYHPSNVRRVSSHASLCVVTQQRPWQKNGANDFADYAPRWYQRFLRFLLLFIPAFRLRSQKKHEREEISIN